MGPQDGVDSQQGSPKFGTSPPHPFAKPEGFALRLRAPDEHMVTAEDYSGLIVHTTEMRNFNINESESATQKNSSPRN